MKIIEALWEKENLNKETFEILIGENDDDYLEIKNIISNIKAEYIVAKVPNKKVIILEKFQLMGFRFIETQISLVKNLLAKTTSTFRIVTDKIDFIKTATLEEIKEISSNISDNMFFTDRIALDKQFGVEVANLRYKKWITNEYGKEEIEIFKINKKGKNIGFVMTKKIGENEVNILLGGIYSKYQGLGYGSNVVYKPIEYYLNSGKKVLRTKVSSNNLDVIKLYISLGYQIENVDYILVKNMEGK